MQALQEIEQNTEEKHGETQAAMVISLTAWLWYLAQRHLCIKVLLYPIFKQCETLETPLVKPVGSVILPTAHTFRGRDLKIERVGMLNVFLF